jgi:hypothetical protein
MNMEVSIGCGTASVAVVDENYAPIVEFNQVLVIGGAGFCNTSGNRTVARLSD